MTGPEPMATRERGAIRVDEREFLEGIRDLAIDAISERRVIIAEGVSVSVPPDHPLQQILILVTNRLLKTNGLRPETDSKIKEAARKRVVSGATWDEIASEFGEAFVKDLQKASRYKPRFELWRHCFQSIEDQHD